MSAHRPLTDAQRAALEDPGLAQALEQLRAHALAGAAALVVGAPGAGRTALVEALAARLAPGLPLLRNGAEPGAWLLYDELDQLSPDGLARLQALLRARLEPPAPPSPPAPRGGLGPAFAPVLGHSRALVEELEKARLAAQAGLTALITGEPGVGKERLARAMHEASGRAGPFVALDLGAVAENLVEAELFGHVKGAFTGAERDRLGAMRSAQGGTLFLDEIGNLSLGAQARLLRALQEREVRPVGGDRAVAVDLLVVAATNADLEGMAGRGAFRLDLLGRLGAVRLRLPPLRERGSDVLELARAACAAPLSPAAEAALLAWRWPGNVRELHHRLRWAEARLRPGEALGPQHLELPTPGAAPTPLFVLARPGQERCPGLEPRLAAALGAARVELPPLSARGPASLRHHLRAALGPHRITAEAEAALVARAWPGQLPELVAALRALASIADPIDLAAVRRLSGQGPLRLLHSPQLLADGSVGGLISEVEGPALLLGRAGTWAELRALRGDAALQRRLDAVVERLGAQEPACLSLALPGLSRAHLLIWRGPAGLEAQALPGAALPCQISQLGVAGALCLELGEEGGPRLQLFAFDGPAAWAEGALLALRRSLTGGADQRTAQPGERAPAEAPGPRRVWRLEPAEEELLAGLIFGWEEGDFQGHLRRGLAEAGAEGARLRDYLLGTRAAQYCGRLYEHNPEAAAALAERLGPRLAGLPAQLRRALEREA